MHNIVKEQAESKGYIRFQNFRMSHSAPMSDGFNAPLCDLTMLYPKDIYIKNAHKLYSSYFDDLADEKAIQVMHSVRDRNLIKRVIDYLKEKLTAIWKKDKKTTQDKKALQFLDKAIKLYEKARDNGVVVSGDEEFYIGKDDDGKLTAFVEKDILDGIVDKKEQKDIVANFLRDNIGKIYKTVQGGDLYIGKDLPKEYVGSTYTYSLAQRQEKVYKDKMVASFGLGDIIGVSKEKSFEGNRKIKHSEEAKLGWYRYSTRIGVPKYNSDKTLNHYNIYTADLIARQESDKKKYLYDILNIEKVGIKKEHRATSGIAVREETSPVPNSNNSILQNNKNVNQNNKENKKFSIDKNNIEPLTSDKTKLIKTEANLKNDKVFTKKDAQAMDIKNLVIMKINFIYIS